MFINQLFCLCFDTSTAYAASSLWSCFHFKIKLWTVQPRAALDLCQYIKLYSRGEVGRFRPASSVAGLPGAALTVQSLA